MKTRLLLDALVDFVFEQLEYADHLAALWRPGGGFDSPWFNLKECSDDDCDYYRSEWLDECEKISLRDVESAYDEADRRLRKILEVYPDFDILNYAMEKPQKDGFIW